MAAAENKIFPVLKSYRDAENKKDEAAVRAHHDCFLVIGAPWDLMLQHEKQALKNHSQTIQRLAERGGLSVCEMLAVLIDQKYERVDFADANARVMQLITRHSLRRASAANASDEITPPPAKN